MKNLFSAAATALLVGTVGAQNITEAENDINTLNYALTLEHLESAFYSEFQAVFTAANFTAAGYPAQAYNYLALIQTHEAAHVQLLTTAVTAAGGTPAAAGVYNFSGVVDVPSYLAYAKVFENVGVSAYDGAIDAISDPTYQEVAATIATVEGRHAAYLNYLNDVVPFPSFADTTDTPSQVAQLVAPYISSAATTLNVTLPIVRNGTSDYVPETAEQAANDVLTLKFAYTAETLGATFYNTWLPTFTADNFTAAGYPNGTYMYLQTIQAYENAHVSYLAQVLTSLNQTVPGTCNFSYPVTDIHSFLYLSSILQNTDTEAYDGAVNTITNPTLQTAAASIATVEARFASYANYLADFIPFPAVLDTPLTPTQIVALVSQFIVSCPTPLELPTYPPGFTAPNNTQPQPQQSGETTVYPPMVPPYTLTSTQALPPGFATCNVVDPTRTEAPWANSTNAYPQTYNTATEVCVNGNFICPSSAPNVCGYACYSSSTHQSCNNGVLQ